MVTFNVYHILPNNSFSIPDLWDILYVCVNQNIMADCYHTCFTYVTAGYRHAAATGPTWKVGGTVFENKYATSASAIICSNLRMCHLKQNDLLSSDLGLLSLLGGYCHQRETHILLHPEETLIITCKTKWCHSPQDQNLNSHHYENLRFLGYLQ